MSFDIGDARRKIELAYEEVFRLCGSRGRPRRWTMSVPVREDDSDIVICNALKAAFDALKRLEHYERGAEDTPPHDSE